MASGNVGNGLLYFDRKKCFNERNVSTIEPINDIKVYQTSFIARSNNFRI